MPAARPVAAPAAHPATAHALLVPHGLPLRHAVPCQLAHAVAAATSTTALPARGQQPLRSHVCCTATQARALPRHRRGLLPPMRAAAASAPSAEDSEPDFPERCSRVLERIDTLNASDPRTVKVRCGGKSFVDGAPGSRPWCRVRVHVLSEEVCLRETGDVPLPRAVWVGGWMHGWMDG
eukprot:365661-Chlamydomonas_euryale.AAC.83